MKQASYIKNIVLNFFLVFILVNSGHAQFLSDSQQPWKAQWITGPGPLLTRSLIETDPSLRNFGVFRFRKNFQLDSIPSSFIIHISADNRYKLFVNEKLVSVGPARGDLYFWNYETVDISAYLRNGKNVIAALVWNFAELRPEAQISYRTAFILQGHSKTEEIINTNTGWKTIRDSSYSLIQNQVPGFYAAGPGEMVDMNKQQRGWMKIDFDDDKWPVARFIAIGHTKKTIYDSPAWMLVPSSLPPMELKYQRLKTLRRADGVSIPHGFPFEKRAFTIPANTSATILLDQGQLTNAYPGLVFSGGKHAGILLSYAEALFIPDTTKWDPGKGPVPHFRIKGKGNRNEVEGKIFIGTKDSIVSDGSLNQDFTPLWWRTYRYIQLKIHTKEEPLVIEDIYGTSTAYPFEYKSKFETDEPQLQKILDIGWHTARLCAHETYMDCPYYEQLQYIGDTRIQALVSLYNSGDDRLIKNALSQFDHSQIAEGITLSRWPSFTPQQIPTFSLWYIGMLHDYYSYGPDTNFVKEKLPGTRQVLSWFSLYQSTDGSLKNLPYWNYTDLLNLKEWVYGMAPVGKNGESAILDIHLLWTYRIAAEMEMKMGLKELAKQYLLKAEQLEKTIQKKYWHQSSKLFADTEEKNSFSQHANALAILSGLVNGKQASNLAEKISADTSLAQASIYFKYYVHQALIKAGLGNDYLNWLDIWKENMKMGLTTWAEMSDVNASRSDCHAWGASPNIEFFRTVLGIDTDAPGFTAIRITPHLGKLEKLAGEIPHPEGRIAVKYNKKGNVWHIEIELPQSLKGRFFWKGKSYVLKGGKNNFRI